MKRLILVPFILVMFFAVKSEAMPLDYGGGYAEFHAALSPYGSWFELNSGVIAWHPYNMRRDWVPYRYGRWAWTADGWYWDSYEPFGYIVFHYGRWYYDDYYGWIWIPDDQWAPAWVEWRYNDDYIGWAPLSPYASFSINLGIHFVFNYTTPYSYWHFVRFRHMCDPYVYKYYVPSYHKYRIFSKTKYRSDYGYSNGRVINRGVGVDFVRRHSGERIVERNIQRVENPRNLDGGRTNRTGDVRAYIIPRDKFNRNELNSLGIQRGARGSSLNGERIGVNGRAMPERTDRGQLTRDRNQMDNARPEPNIRRDNRQPEINRENSRGQERRQPNIDRRNSRQEPQPRREFTPPQRRNEGVDRNSSRREAGRENPSRRAPEPRRDNGGRQDRNNSDSRIRR